MADTKIPFEKLKTEGATNQFLGYDGSGLPTLLPQSDFSRSTASIPAGILDDLNDLIKFADVSDSNIEKSGTIAALSALIGAGGGAAGSGGLLNVQSFTANGIYTPTAGTDSVLVICTGAGGGGAGNNLIESGSNGSASTFLTLTGGGGEGGDNSGATSNQDGGIGTGGIANLQGGGGGTSTGNGGHGGNSYWGGGACGTSNRVAQPGGPYGGGGAGEDGGGGGGGAGGTAIGYFSTGFSGAAVTVGTGGAGGGAGGAGGDGAVVIFEYGSENISEIPSGTADDTADLMRIADVSDSNNEKSITLGALGALIGGGGESLQRFIELSGSSNYTPTAGTETILVFMVGGGGSGGSGADFGTPAAGNAGTDTTFSTFTAGAGLGGTVNGAIANAPTTSTEGVPVAEVVSFFLLGGSPGSAGIDTQAITGSNFFRQAGPASAFFGGNYGAGGAGSTGTNGENGGAGSSADTYMILMKAVDLDTKIYAYSVGAGGIGPQAGSSGKDGAILILEFGT
jgi:hypothetical protein